MCFMKASFSCYLQFLFGGCTPRQYELIFPFDDCSQYDNASLVIPVIIRQHVGSPEGTADYIIQLQD